MGSSPLSRGIPGVAAHPLHPRRIIPALAGNTCSRNRADMRRKDHPRSRGEYRTARQHKRRTSGSSPLSRGIRHRLPRIPARPVDHPRSRGEYSRVRVRRRSSYGSSPLSRGIPGYKHKKPLIQGIIPALAGNTHPPAARNWAHQGSSPLSRGIPRRPGRTVKCSWIIPALAGNTHPIIVSDEFPPDHPRSRGEYLFSGAMGIGNAGSSPLSRGILVKHCCMPLWGRIIPALAGNTVPATSSPLCNGDHPRSRGEYRSGDIWITTSSGSSPLSRGIPPGRA